MPALIGGAMVAGAAISAGGAAAANHSAMSASKEMYKNRYQWQVKDLQKAGLNPMLSFQNAAPVPNTPQFQNVGEAAVRGGNVISGAAMMKRQLDSQLAVNDSVVLKNQMDAKSAESQAALNGVETAWKAAGLPYVGSQAQAQLRLTGGQLQEIQSRINVQGMEVNKMLAEIDNLHASSALERQKIQESKAGIVEILSRAGLNSANTRLSQLNGDQLEKIMPYVIQLKETESGKASRDVPKQSVLGALWGTLGDVLGTDGSWPLLVGDAKFMKGPK